MATATTTVKTTPSKPITAKAISIAPVTINRPLADDSLTKSSLDICVKITELPTELNTNTEGTKEFFVTANNRQVFIALKAKQYNKLLEAQAKWSSWIGRISGKLGASTIDGFILEQGSVQAFEKSIKAKPTDSNKNDNVSRSSNATKTDPSNSNNHKCEVISNTKYKQIRSSFYRYVTEGHLPPKDKINKILAPYNLTGKAIEDILDRLLTHNQINRLLGFQIEKTYFQLLDQWQDTYFNLAREIATRLRIHPKITRNWLDFLHRRSDLINALPLPSEEVSQQIIALYLQYLKADEFPDSPLHCWIAQSIPSDLTEGQVHKVLSEYRIRLRQKLFDKDSARTTLPQLPSITNTEAPQLLSVTEDKSNP